MATGGWLLMLMVMLMIMAVSSFHRKFRKIKLPSGTYTVSTMPRYRREDCAMPL